MDALTRIVQQIAAENEKKMADYKEARLTEITAAFEEEKQRIEKDEEKQLLRQTAAVSKELKMALERQKVQMRQTVLTKKQQLLDALFDELVQRMTQWDEAAFADFAAGILTQVPIIGEGEVILGELSAGRLSADWLSQFQTGERSFVLSDELIKQQGGFVVRQGRIEYNFLFSALVADLKEKESYYVAEKLFQ
ncbi:V-type ATP synthase subunit E [Vagococcus acidifermentans]|uniref:ATPase V n=1 Tax=Vagococcus acidifermentans TaxID=564710 RepID=A0A430AQU2_9ENTE|nr:V-type ATP synthase subunit E [Vagococcus acidifermentans]RSU10425.1 hypothetical protein CBF27_10435 [Vagococcus acidifermentans]